MASSIREVMTPSPLALQSTTPIAQAARTMRDADIGDVLVLDDAAGVCGIVTDRDIVVRAVADGLDCASAQVGEICSRDIVSIDVDADVHDAARLMRDRALRRVPVMEGGFPVGIVSIGDLAVEQDPTSALAGISAAPPNH